LTSVSRSSWKRTPAATTDSGTSKDSSAKVLTSRLQAMANRALQRSKSRDAGTIEGSRRSLVDTPTGSLEDDGGGSPQGNKLKSSAGSNPHLTPGGDNLSQTNSVDGLSQESTQNSFADTPRRGTVAANSAVPEGMTLSALRGSALVSKSGGSQGRISTPSTLSSSLKLRPWSASKGTGTRTTSVGTPLSSAKRKFKEVDLSGRNGSESLKRKALQFNSLSSTPRVGSSRRPSSSSKRNTVASPTSIWGTRKSMTPSSTLKRKATTPVTLSPVKPSSSSSSRWEKAKRKAQQLRRTSSSRRQTVGVRNTSGSVNVFDDVDDQLSRSTGSLRNDASGDDDDDDEDIEDEAETLSQVAAPTQHSARYPDEGDVEEFEDDDDDGDLLTQRNAASITKKLDFDDIDEGLSPFSSTSSSIGPGSVPLPAPSPQRQVSDGSNTVLRTVLQGTPSGRSATAGFFGAPESIEDEVEMSAFDDDSFVGARRQRRGKEDIEEVEEDRNFEDDIGSASQDHCVDAVVESAMRTPSRSRRRHESHSPSSSTPTSSSRRESSMHTPAGSKWLAAIRASTPHTPQRSGTTPHSGHSSEKPHRRQRKTAGPLTDLFRRSQNRDRASARMGRAQAILSSTGGASSSMGAKRSARNNTVDLDSDNCLVFYVISVHRRSQTVLRAWCSASSESAVACGVATSEAELAVVDENGQTYFWLLFEAAAPTHVDLDAIESSYLFLKYPLDVLQGIEPHSSDPLRAAPTILNSFTWKPGTFVLLFCVVLFTFPPFFFF